MNLDHIDDVEPDVPENQVTDKQLAGCTELRNLLEIQMAIMQKHVSRHKWFRHLPDDNVALLHFVREYGWIMKETYCYACKSSDKCQHSIDLRNGHIETNPKELDS